MSYAQPSAQPNVPGRGITASYSRRFWGAVVVIGVGAGLGAAALIVLLRAVQHLAWDYSSGPFLDAVEHTSSAHRVIVLTVGGVVAGLGVVALARSGTSDVSEALWLRRARLPLLASFARAAHSIVTVALGASLGREAAPQQAGAAIASTLGDRAGFPEWQRRLLVACGAGAGMAAVYNIPFGGALFALEVLLGTLALPFVLPALATALIATAVAWVYIPKAPTYLIAEHVTHPTQIVWAVIAGPVAGVVSVLYVRLVFGANRLRPRTTVPRLLVPIVVFVALGVLSIAYPQVLGNGRSVVQLGLVGEIAAGLTAVLLILKPLATAGCLGSGAPGGLFTPTLAVGVLLGSLGRQGVGAPVAWGAARYLRGDRRRGGARGEHAGPARGDRADARADAQGRGAAGPDPAGGRRRDAGLAPHGRPLDLLGQADGRTRGGGGRDRRRTGRDARVAGPTRRPA